MKTFKIRCHGPGMSIAEQRLEVIFLQRHLAVVEVGNSDEVTQPISQTRAQESWAFWPHGHRSPLESLCLEAQEQRCKTSQLSEMLSFVSGMPDPTAVLGMGQHLVYMV